MRKLIVSLVVVALLTTGCLVQPSSGGTATAGSKYDAGQDARIVALEGIVLGPNGLQALVGNIQNKISGISDVQGLIVRVNSAESRLSAVEGKVGSSTGGGSGVTQAQIDALSARIKTLEDWKATAGSGGSSGGGTVPGSNILDQDGDLQLLLEREKEEEVWLDDEVAETWRLTVKNTGTSSTYFRINADFDCEESVAVIAGTTITPDYSAASTVQAIPSTFTGSVTNLSTLITSTGSSNKIYIGKSREESMYVTVKVNYSTATGKRWTWDFSIRDVGD